MTYWKRWLLGVCAALLKAGSIEAAPLMDDGGYTINLPVALDGQVSVVVYRDHEQAGRYWWAPYQIELAKNPVTATKRIQWNARTDQPTLSLVSRLRPWSERWTSYVKEAIAQQSGEPADALELRVIPLAQIAAEVELYQAYGVTYGAWQPTTSLLSSFVPEVFELEQGFNQDMLEQYERTGQVQVLIRYTATALGYTSGGSLGRSFDYDCLFQKVARRETDNVNSIAGQEWKERALRSRLARVEQECVLEQQSRGEVTPSAILDTWVKFLVDQKILSERMSESGERFYEIANSPILVQFTGERGLFTYELAPELGSFPMTFTRLVFDLPAPQ